MIHMLKSYSAYALLALALLILYPYNTRFSKAYRAIIMVFMCVYLVVMLVGIAVVDIVKTVSRFRR
jgi:hypothetical protein